jgi:tripartite-type tricarboxylate transporter receptor subunit TctC
MLAPAGTPRTIVDMLSKAINDALKSEDVAQQMRSQGMEVLGGTPEEFAQRIKNDTARWDAVLRAADLGK